MHLFTIKLQKSVQDYLKANNNLISMQMIRTSRKHSYSKL